MARQTLVEATPTGSVVRDAEVLDRPARLAAIASPLAWRILQELARAPDYPNALAARLKVHEQKVYYHVRRLEAAGLLKVLRTEAKQGAAARILAPTADAFAVVLKSRGTAASAPALALAGPVAPFLEEFSRDGAFQGSIVVGSPYQHGPFLTTARDTPYAVHLGFYLGRLFALPRGFVVKLDTDVKAAGADREPLILVGGPVVNIVTFDLNAHLAVNFDWKQVWRIESSLTRRSYADEHVGLVAKLRNPWNPKHPVVLLSGIHHAGTSAAILGLTQFADEVLDGYEPGRDFYRVVSGQDRDGDGRLDRVTVLE
ncbi:MAG TPA: helix-turn-helix domain-containing protein [Thermoplasmata archaeon]|nr:helix-turn-helix domain-containing protein [Thermoplasmata archaeon]